MRTNRSTRREFLTDATRAAAAAWLTLQIPWAGSLAGCAREEAAPGGRFERLTPEEASTMAAFAAQIIPPDAEAAGAVEVGAMQFVDRAFGAPFFAASVPLVRAGLADLDARARVAGAARGFASLAGAQQIAILRQIEPGDFFKAARTLVIIGTFADPSYGGNLGGAGWTMIGIDHRPSYVAPFGYYDAQADKGSPGRAA